LTLPGGRWRRTSSLETGYTAMKYDDSNLNCQKRHRVRDRLIDEALPELR
jgi:hypothetical protein